MVITIYFISKIIKIDRFFAYFSLPEGPEGFRLRKAFNHLVFIDDDDDVDILRSPWTCGELGSNFTRNSSFCNEIRRNSINVTFVTYNFKF